MLCRLVSDLEAEKKIFSSFLIHENFQDSTVNGFNFSSVFLFFIQIAQQMKMRIKITRAAAAAAMIIGMTSSPRQIFVCGSDN